MLIQPWNWSEPSLLRTNSIDWDEKWRMIKQFCFSRFGKILFLILLFWILLGNGFVGVSCNTRQHEKEEWVMTSNGLGNSFFLFSSPRPQEIMHMKYLSQRNPLLLHWHCYESTHTHIHTHTHTHTNTHTQTHTHAQLTKERKEFFIRWNIFFVDHILYRKKKGRKKESKRERQATTIIITKRTKKSL